MKDMREGILRWGTVAVVALTPLLYFGMRVFPHISSKTFFLYGAIELLFFVWLYALCVDPAYRAPRRTWLYGMPLFLYGVWMTIAGLLAPNPALSFLGTLGRGTGLITLYHMLALACVVASVTYRYGAAYVRSLLGALVLSGSIVGASIWMGNEGLNWSGSALRDNVGGGLVGNSSLAGGYLLLVLGVGAVLLGDRAVRTRTKWWIASGMALILTSPIYLNLLGAFSGKGIVGSARGALAGIGVALVSALVWRAIVSSQKTVRVIGVIALVAGCTLFALGWKTLLAPESKLHTAFVSSASGTRFIFWDTAQRVLDDRPWFGYGPENFTIAFQHYFNSDMLLKEYGVETWTDRAHNLYYDTGVAGGYPAIAFYAAFLCLLVYATAHAVRRGLLERWQGAVIIGMLAGYVFQNLFYFDSLLSWMVLMSITGVLFGMSAARRTSTWKLAPAYRSAMAFFLLVVMIVVWIPTVWMPSRKAYAIGAVFKTPMNERPEEYATLLRGSSIGNYWDIGGLAHDLYAFYASNPAQTKQNPAIMTYAKQDLTKLLEYLEEVHARNPLDMRLTITLVHLHSTYIYLFDLPLDEALAQHLLGLLEHAEVLSPNNPEVYWGIAQVKVWQGDFEGGRAAYERAIAINPRIPVSYELFINYARIMGDNAGAVRALREAQQHIPGFTIPQQP